MGLTNLIIQYSTMIIENIGYTGVFLLMILESMIAPLPSEAVMPFAGFLIHEGKMTWAGVAFASTLGSLVGSLVSYYLGLFGGKPLILKFGKYLFLDVHHLELTEKFFAKNGEIAVFISRFIPVVRHFISIPAGVGKMNIVKFITYTAIGACGWNVFLTWVGYLMKENWEQIHHYTKYGDIIVISVTLVFIFLFVKKSLDKRKLKAK
ncbi:MAG: DedA family protein [Cyanobacteriota bacterium]